MARAALNAKKCGKIQDDSAPFAFWRSGCSVIPIAPNGSKAPTVPWKRYQTEFATEQELTEWFGNWDYGFAAVTGVISGGLEVIDFDIPDQNEIFSQWYHAIEAVAVWLPVVETPNYGFHVWYRCEEVSPNQVIAYGDTPNKSGQPKALIETRGQGGYIMAPGSSAKCHPTGRPYVQTMGPVLPEIPTISKDDRRKLWAAARRFDKAETAKKHALDLARKNHRRLNPVKRGGSSRTGDDFNSRGDWFGLLQRHGWRSGDGTNWTRPGKSHGTSATLRQAESGIHVLVNFSANSGLEANKTFTLFEAFTALEHNNDFKAAATDLRRQGYGQ